MSGLPEILKVQESSLGTVKQASGRHGSFRPGHRCMG
jgi:hypothetical protein